MKLPGGGLPSQKFAFISTSKFSFTACEEGGIGPNLTSLVVAYPKTLAKGKEDKIGT